MGRPRDGDDRVAWLLQRRRFREALAIASTDRSLRKHSRPQVPLPPLLRPRSCALVFSSRSSRATRAWWVVLVLVLHAAAGMPHRLGRLSCADTKVGFQVSLSKTRH